MKLVSFSVSNYRSIVEAYKLALGNYTVLVGPNNEGKSNIVKAIVLSLNFLTRSRPYRRTRRSPLKYYKSEFRFDYEWERDFPVSLRTQNPSGRSEFTLEFQLTEDDFQKFREQVGVNLNTNLKVKLGFGSDDVSIEILMKGRGKKTLNKRREEISDFLRKHVSSQYISALRPSEMALGIVESLIEGELSSLESNPEYNKLIEELQKLQEPILNTISETLKEIVSDFVPGVNNVKISNERLTKAFRSSFNIMVDDGAETELSSKGDGIISLTTMALMKYVSEESLGDKALILSIEEPESHLHPEAIHGLRQVLKDISKEQQVVITTHSPILVERKKLSQNIIVQDGRAVKAKNIRDIRDALGIQMSDNLMGASVVLIVEGEEDRDLLHSWLSSFSSQLRNAISSHILVIDHLGGASNLHYKVTFYKQNVYNIHVFMDNDEEGRKATRNALERNVLDEDDYNLATCQGMKNSELEDLLVLDSYVEPVKEKFGVNLQQSDFRNSKSKWSDRAKNLFQKSGKMWSDSKKTQIKRVVVDECIEHGINSLNSHRKAPIEHLISALETKIKQV